MSTYSPLFSTRKTVPVTLSPTRNRNSYFPRSFSNCSYALRSAGAAAAAATAVRARLAPSLAGRAAAPTDGTGATRLAGAASSRAEEARGHTVRSWTVAAIAASEGEQASWLALCVPGWLAAIRG